MRRALTTGSSDGPFPPTACTSAKSDMAYRFTDVLSFRSGDRFVWGAVSCGIPCRAGYPCRYITSPTSRHSAVDRRSASSTRTRAKQLTSPHLRRDWARPRHICAGDWARPCHICTGTGLTAATSAPGLGHPRICTCPGRSPATSAPRRLRSFPPHLHRDWAHPCIFEPYACQAAHFPTARAYARCCAPWPSPGADVAGASRVPAQMWVG